MRERASFQIHAGTTALAHLRQHGLHAADVGCVPAAAGGPKGLALLELDKRLFDVGEGWLRNAGHLDLIGSSIGAWRMAAASMNDPVAALTRLEHAYLAQQFNRQPTARAVADECRKLPAAVLGSEPVPCARANVSLSVIAARARGRLDGRRSRAAFAHASIDNLLSRERLALHMERVVFTTGAPRALTRPFDAFGLTKVGLSRENCADALLASGSIPLLCEPVCNPAGAPPGDYWDGGLIDYHLLLPYHELPGLVLFPHFVSHLTPGWLDKFLPWRKRSRSKAWLANVIVVSPSPSFIERLPHQKLPDRRDFHRYGGNLALRQRDWRRAIAESQRFADDVLAWLNAPDPTLVQPL